MSIDLGFDFESREYNNALIDMAFYLLEHNTEAIYEKNYEAFNKPDGLAEQLSGFVFRLRTDHPVNMGKKAKKNQKLPVNNKNHILSLEYYGPHKRLANNPRIDCK